MTKNDFGDLLQRVELQYAVSDQDRASLSWRLTEKEKADIIESINLPKNQKGSTEVEKVDLSLINTA